MAELLELREVEEAAVSLNRVDETENGIEPRRIGRIGFPRDDFAAAGFQHLASFGDEVRQQVIHVSLPLVRSEGLWTMMVKYWFEPDALDRGLPAARARR